MPVIAPVLPEITKVNAPYFEGAAAGVLRTQHCPACGQYVFPPGPRCPQCLTAPLEWADVSGKGVLWSWIVMHQGYFPDVKDRLPYVVAHVRLDEGPLLMTNLVEAGDTALRCDMPVEVVFETVGEIVVPAFRPAGGER